MDIRTQILDAAAKEITQRGIVQFSLSSLAHSVSASKSTVYSLFPSKDELLVELFCNQVLKRIGIGLALDDENLPVAHKLAGYFSYTIFANLEQPDGNGARFLPSNPQLWKRARPDSIERMKRLVKQVDTIPLNYLQRARLEGQVKGSDQQFNHLLVDLLCTERGAIILFSNPGHEQFMSSVDGDYFLQRQFERASRLDWQQPLSDDLSQIRHWLGKHLKQHPFYSEE